MGFSADLPPGRNATTFSSRCLSERTEFGRYRPLIPMHIRLSLWKPEIGVFRLIL